MAVTVYNMVQGGGVKIGDSVAIPEPFGQKVQVKHKDKVSPVGLAVGTLEVFGVIRMSFVVELYL